MAFSTFIQPAGDDDSFHVQKDSAMKEMAAMFGPGHIDQQIRAAIMACWMCLPEDRRNAAEVEKEIRRIVERALANYREDAAAFGQPS